MELGLHAQERDRAAHQISHHRSALYGSSDEDDSVTQSLDSDLGMEWTASSSTPATSYADVLASDLKNPLEVMRVLAVCYPAVLLFPRGCASCLQRDRSDHEGALSILRLIDATAHEDAHTEQDAVTWPCRRDALSVY